MATVIRVRDAGLSEKVPLYVVSALYVRKFKGNLESVSKPQLNLTSWEKRVSNSKIRPRNGVYISYIGPICNIEGLKYNAKSVSVLDRKNLFQP